MSDLDFRRKRPVDPSALCRCGERGRRARCGAGPRTTTDSRGYISADERKNDDGNVLIASGRDPQPAPANQTGQDDSAADRQQTRMREQQRGDQYAGAEKRMYSRVPAGLLVTGVPLLTVGTQHTACP